MVKCAALAGRIQRVVLMYDKRGPCCPGLNSVKTELWTRFRFFNRFKCM